MVKRIKEFNEPVIETSPIVGAGSRRDTSILDAVGNIMTGFLKDGIANETAAVKNFNTTNDLNLINAVTRIEREAFEDPAGQKKLGLDFENSYLEGLPESIRPKTKAKFRALLNKLIGESNEISVKKMQATSLANSAQLSVQRSAILKSSGRNLASTDPVAKQAAEDEIAVLRADLIERLSEHVVDVFGNQRPVYEPPEAAAAMQEFNDTYIGEWLTKRLDSESDPVRRHLELLDGGPFVGIPTEEVVEREVSAGITEEKFVIAEKQVRALDLVTQKKRDDIISLSAKKMETSEKIRVKDQAATDLAQKADWNLTGAALAQNLQTATDAERVDPDTIREMGTLGSLNPADVEGYVEMSIKPRPVFDNADLVRGFDFSLTAGSDLSELLADPNIAAEFTPTTYNRLVAQNQVNMDVAAGVSPGPLKKKIDDNFTLLKSGLKVKTPLFAAQLDSKATLRENSALSEYWDRVAPRVDPVTQREVATPEDPQEVMEDLVRRARATFMSSGPGSDQVLPMGYGGAREDVTVENLDIGFGQLERQFDSGRINQKVFDSNILLYDVWYDLAPQIVQNREESASTSKQATKLPPRRVE